MCGLAEPDGVVVSDAVERLIGDRFELAKRVPQLVKGVAEPVIHYRVIDQRDTKTTSARPLVGRTSEYSTTYILGIKSFMATIDIKIGFERGLNRTLDWAKAEKLL